MKAIVFVALSLFAITANAQPKSKADEAAAAYKDGQARYMSEDYDGAAKQFQAAFSLVPDPVYLYNVAQAYRMGKKCADASEFYHRYLKEAKKAPNEEQVKAYIAEVDDCARKQPSNPVVVQPAEPVKPVESLKIEEPRVVGPDEPRDGGGSSSRRTMGLVIAGVGAVAIANGFYFMYRVGQAEKDANAICPGSNCDWTQEKKEQREPIDARGKRDEKIMVASWIVGGAAVATGVVLYVMGRDSKKESPVAITPTRDGAQATFSLSF